MIIKMNDDATHDVDMSQADVQVDASKPFHEDEGPSINVLNQILRSQLELKNSWQTVYTTNLFIEYQIDKYGDMKIIPSGLSLTTAGFWLLTIGDDIVITISYKFLKHLYDNRDAYEIETKNNSKKQEDHIGYGLIIPMDRLIELYNYYIEHQQAIRIAALRKELFDK